MEFKFNINNILGEEITKVDSSLRPFRKNSSGVNLKNQLCTIIDDMGIASATAQGLSGAITSASRLKTSDHLLYVMKEESGHGGDGTVVGILKVGHKKLFVYDHHGNQHEMEPMCVLDFYIHESMQRTGYGKKLFEYMLKEEGIRPAQLAIDRPSAKFVNFLGRHYNLKATIRQVNNYVIFEGFFKDQPSEVNIKHRQRKPPLHLCRQQSTDRWQHPLEALSVASRASSATVRSQIDRELPGCQEVRRPSSGPPRSGLQRLLAWNDPEEEDALQEPSRKEALKNVKPRDVLPSGGSERPLSGTRVGGTIGTVGSPTHRGMGAQHSMYSRHQEAAPAAPVTRETARASTPPMLRRDGPSQDYLALRGELNTASTYQDRRGHLVVTDENSTPDSQVKSRHTVQNGQSERFSNPSSAASSPKHVAPSRAPDSAWNIFGVQASPKHSAAPAKRHQHSRLW